MGEIQNSIIFCHFQIVCITLFFVKLCSQIFLVSLFIQEVCSITLTVQPVRRIVCSKSVGQFWGYDYTRPTVFFIVLAPFFDFRGCVFVV